METLRFADSKRAAIALTRSERATITAAVSVLQRADDLVLLLSVCANLAVR